MIFPRRSHRARLRSGLGTSAALVLAALVPAAAKTLAVKSVTPVVVASPRGVVVPVTRVGGSVITVRTPCGGSATLSRWTDLGRPMVVIDPGHGGDEEGAKSPDAQLLEKNLNLAVAEKTQALLEADGYPVVLTRTADYRVTLATRGQIVQAARPRVFVSIHHNAVPDGPLPKPGTETYYQVASSQSRRLAGLVYEETVASLARFPASWMGDTDAGVKTRRNSRGGDFYGILRRSAGIPSTLAELAFISNPSEAALLARPDVQQAEAQAVAKAIVRFLTTSDPGSGFVIAYPRTDPAGPGGGSEGCTDPPLI